MTGSKTEALLAPSPAARTWRRRIVFDLFFVVAVASVFYLYKLGDRSFENHDHEKIAGISYQMLQNGEWLTMRSGSGGLYTNKPHLLFWSIDLCSLPFHKVTPWSSRFPIALAAIGACATTFLFALLLFGRQAAYLASFMLMGVWGFSWDARRAWFDVPLTFFVLLAMLLSYCGYKTASARFQKIYYFCAGIAIALAFLIKGPPGLLWTIVPFTVFLLYRRSFQHLRRYLIFAIVPMLLSLGVWLILYVQAIGLDFLYASTSKEMMSHLLDRSDQWARQPFYYYLMSVPLDFVPWSIFFPAAAVVIFKRFRREFQEEYLFLLIWIGCVLLLLSFPYSKTTRYSLPVYPALAMIVAGACTDRLHSEDEMSPRLRQLFDHPALWPSLGMSLVVFACFLTALLLPRFRYLAGLSLIFGMILLPLVASLKSAAPPKRFLRSICIMIIFMLFLGLAHIAYLVDNDDDNSPMKVLHRQLSASREHEQVATYKFSTWLLDYYFSENLPRLNEPAELENYLSNEEPVYCLMEGKEYDSLPEGIRQEIGLLSKVKTKRGSMFCIASNAAGANQWQNRLAESNKNETAGE